MKLSNDTPAADRNPPVHFAPFNAQFAMAGAPFCCCDGTKADVESYLNDRVCGVIRHPLGENYGACWRLNGEILDAGPMMNSFDLVMLPICYIEGDPVYFDSELRQKNGALVTGQMLASLNAGELSELTLVKPASLHSPRPGKSSVFRSALAAIGSMLTGAR